MIVQHPRATAQRPTLWLNSARTADVETSGELLPLIYDELRHLAVERMASEPRERTLQPTALVHEAWVRLCGGKARGWNDRMHFFRTAALTMRRILVDRARRRSCQRYGGDYERVQLDKQDVAAAEPEDRVLMVDDALEELKLVDAVSARVVELKFFAGLTNREIASMTDVSERTVERQWTYAKAQIIQIIERMGR